MKCPNCSFNNIASAAICKICGTELEVVPGANNDTLALDEALKGIFAPKVPAPSALPISETEEEITSSWEPIEDDAVALPGQTHDPRLREEGDHTEKDRTEEEFEEQPDDAGSEDEVEVFGEEMHTRKISMGEASNLPPLPSGSTPAHHADTPEKEKKEIFLNPLTLSSAREEGPEPIQNPRKPIVPVYEDAKEGIDIDEEAENFFALPKDSAANRYAAPEKRRRSKTDEIAAIAMVILLICLGTLIYFAVQMSRKPENSASVTTPPVAQITVPGSTEAETKKSSGTTVTTKESSTTTTTTSSSSETTSSSENTTRFDESYFTKSGNLSGGSGSESDSLSKVRMGDHYYFHRFVFDFLGDKVPTYYVSILEGGYLVQIRVENIADYTKNYEITSWSTVAKSIEINADSPSSILINIHMYEPAMVHTYGLEEPGRIVLDIRGESNRD